MRLNVVIRSILVIMTWEKVMRTLIFFAIACLMVSTGCASNVTKTTEKGLFHIKLSGKKPLLKYGRNEVDIYVTDDKGRGVEGAQIEITPWMPEHGHGTMWPPTITDKGNGSYKAVIPLIMIGHWELKIKIRKNDIEDITAFDFPSVSK